MKRGPLCPAWCRRCQLGEHRGDPVAVAGHLGVVVTLVQPHDTREPYAEVRGRFRLRGRDEQRQARELLRLLRALARLRQEVTR